MNDQIRYLARGDLFYHRCPFAQTIRIVPMSYVERREFESKYQCEEWESGFDEEMIRVWGPCVDAFEVLPELARGPVSFTWALRLAFCGETAALVWGTARWLSDLRGECLRPILDKIGRKCTGYPGTMRGDQWEDTLDEFLSDDLRNVAEFADAVYDLLPDPAEAARAREKFRALWAPLLPRGDHPLLLPEETTQDLETNQSGDSPLE